MTDSATFELEDDPRPARRARQQRLATRAVALAVPVLLVTGLLAAVAHDTGGDESRVATAGPADGPIQPEELVVEVPSTVTTVVPLPVEVPKVTVPKLPRLPKVTVTTVPLPLTAPSTPTCPTTPPAYHPTERGIYEIPTAGGTGRVVIPWSDTTFVQDFAFSPDGTRVAFVRGWLDNDGQTPSKVYVATRDFSGERHVPLEPLGPSSLRWSPDGRFVAFFAQPAPGDQKELYLLDPATDAVRRVSTDNVGGMGPAVWSPDGSRLAWSSNSTGGVWVAEATAGSPVVKVADDVVIGLDWSPDGRQLAFGRVGGGVFVVDRDGANRRLLHATGIRVAWSRKNRAHLVVDTAGLLYRVDPDTAASSFLAAGHVQAWLPDGSRLVAGSSHGLGLVGWDGCVQTVVAGSGNEIGLHTWTPDSRTFVFHRYR